MNSVPRHVAEEDQFIFYQYLASKRTIIPIKNIRINLFVNSIWDIMTFIRTTNTPNAGSNAPDAGSNT